MAEKKLKDHLRPFNMAFQFHNKDQLVQDDIIAEVQKFSHTDADGDKDDYEVAEDPEAVSKNDPAEDAAATADAQAAAAKAAKLEAEKAADNAQTREIKEVVNSIRSGDKRFTWMMMTPDFSYDDRINL